MRRQAHCICAGSSSETLARWAKMLSRPEGPSRAFQGPSGLGLGGADRVFPIFSTKKKRGVHSRLRGWRQRHAAAIVLLCMFGGFIWRVVDALRLLIHSQLRILFVPFSPNLSMSFCVGIVLGHYNFSLSTR